MANDKVTKLEEAYKEWADVGAGGAISQRKELVNAALAVQDSDILNLPVAEQKKIHRMKNVGLALAYRV